MYMQHVSIDGNHNRILKRLGDISRNDVSFTRPLLLYGENGCGRLHHIIEYILYVNYSEYHTFSEDSESSPNVRVSELSTPDIIVVDSPVPIAEMRDKLSESRTRPLELKHKYIIARDFDLSSKEVQDLFLKTLEDMPVGLYPFVTVSDRSRLYSTVESRMVAVGIPTLKQKELERICSSDGRLKDYLPLLKQYPCFGSVSQPQLFMQLQIGQFYDRVMKSQIFEVQGIVDGFMERAENTKYPMGYILDFLMRYISYQLYSEKAEGLYRDTLTKTLSNFAKSFTRYAGSPSRDFLVSVRYQLSSLFLSVMMLRKVYGVKVA